MTIQIEKNVPLEPPTSGPHKKERYSKYPFADMAVGDSFFVPRKANLMRAYIGTLSVRRADIKEMKFVLRTVEGGCRIWRTA